MSNIIKSLFLSNIIFNKKIALLLWFGLSLVAVMLTLIHHTGINNFYIFRQVFYHTIHHQNLYAAYTTQYDDVNLYGPLFSLIIAPFAMMPIWLGSSLWVMANALLLFFAIMQLPVKKEINIGIIFLCSLEMMNVASWYQSNALIAACIIFGFVYINNGKDWAALLFILLATFIKIYGIVGLSFFFFSRNKLKFVGWFILWGIVFFVLPMIISSVGFIIQSYKDWAVALSFKAAKNIDVAIKNDFQDISVMGMIRRIFQYSELKNSTVMIPALVLFATQYLQIKFYTDLRYRLYLLCSVVLMVVIFSTGSESPTYIIAFPAICLWYFLQPKTILVKVFFIFAFILTSLSYSDLLTPYFREHIARPYSIKALPSFITWLVICWQINRKQFLKVGRDKLGFR